MTRVEDIPGLPVALSPEAIDRELAAMWKQRDDEGGVTRIALGNVVWLASTRHRTQARRIFSRLVVQYPCRLLLLEFHEERTDPEVEAFVSAQCFLSQDIRGEVCCEEIVLRFGAAAFRHVAGAVRALLLPDVPTTFCTVSALPHRFDELTESIAAIADHTLTEVTLLDDPVGGLREMADAPNRAGTLSWFRTTPIREQIASVFDDPQCRALLGCLRAVRVKWCGPDGDVVAITTASLLVGWMASRLGWSVAEGVWPFRYRGPAGEVTVEFLRCDSEEPGDREPKLVEIEFLCTTGDRIRLIHSDRQGSVERVFDGPSRLCAGKVLYVRAHAFDEAEAIIAALNSPARGAIFREAARLAAPLLAAALGRTRAA
jgi:glucose-6-phosphate dehydrogenase assembly protein OpcA